MAINALKLNRLITDIALRGKTDEICSLGDTEFIDYMDSVPRWYVWREISWDIIDHYLITYIESTEDEAYRYRIFFCELEVAYNQSAVVEPPESNSGYKCLYDCVEDGKGRRLLYNCNEKEWYDDFIYKVAEFRD